MNRVGEVNVNKYNSIMKIIEYNNAKDIIVEFENGHKVKSRYAEFKEGAIKSPYDKSMFGTGYLGIGDFKAVENGTHTKAYHYWYDMFKRCFDKKYKEKHNTYKNKVICEEWHDFQNFAKWYYENYYEVEDERMELDKDILYRDNKIYSPNTCIFVPKRINTLFIKCDSVRGKYPIGVTYNKNFYIARCSTLKNGKIDRVMIGRYNNPLDAFYAYKSFKEKYIKEIADNYRDMIPKVLYDAMYDYEVRITD